MNKVDYITHLLKLTSIYLLTLIPPNPVATCLVMVRNNIKVMEGKNTSAAAQAVVHVLEDRSNWRAPNSVL